MQKEFFIYLTLVVLLTVFVSWHYFNFNRDKMVQDSLNFIKVVKMDEPSIGASGIEDRFLITQKGYNTIYLRVAKFEEVDFVYDK